MSPKQRHQTMSPSKRNPKRYYRQQHKRKTRYRTAQQSAILDSKFFDKEKFIHFPEFLKYVSNKTFWLTFCFFDRQTKTITISCTEYARLLHNDVQLLKCKETCNSKAAEIKKLQTQVLYYRKQANKKRTTEMHQEDGEENADLLKVI